MELNYIEMINRNLQTLSQDNLLKALSYVHAISTLQRSEEEIKAIEYDLGIRKEQAENTDIIDAEVKRCTFCGKPLSKVRRMIAGPASFICSECVELCKEILDMGQRAIPGRSSIMRRPRGWKQLCTHSPA